MGQPSGEVIARPMVARACGCLREFQHYAVDKYRAQRLAKFQKTRCEVCVAKLNDEQKQAAANIPKKGEAFKQLPNGSLMTITRRPDGTWTGTLTAEGKTVEADGEGPPEGVAAFGSSAGVLDRQPDRSRGGSPHRFPRLSLQTRAPTRQGHGRSDAQTRGTTGARPQAETGLSGWALTAAKKCDGRWSSCARSIPTDSPARICLIHYSPRLPRVRIDRSRRRHGLLSHPLLPVVWSATPRITPRGFPVVSSTRLRVSSFPDWKISSNRRATAANAVASVGSNSPGESVVRNRRTWLCVRAGRCGPLRAHHFVHGGERHHPRGQGNLVAG